MGFYKYSLDKLFFIPQIITIHYFEYEKDFIFDGESHDFWEFLCVDKGEVLVTADKTKHLLKKGNIIFHKPNQFHSVATNGIIAPNLVVVSFVCPSPAMNYFEDKILQLGEQERRLLAMVISEASNAFSTPLNNPYTTRLEANPYRAPGAEQMIELSLEHFLISLYRMGRQLETNPLLSKSVKLKRDEEIYNHIIAYMDHHICDTLTVEQICHDNLLGRSQLQKLFRNKSNCGIIDYFSQMKITYAKELIREKNFNFTQIADFLGYTSIHYFSRQFKKITGMNPSEYALSIKALSERKPE
ncbi:MAG: AraC family transcriptional regulator [Lachnospiraceae bacterium]